MSVDSRRDPGTHRTWYHLDERAKLKRVSKGVNQRVEGKRTNRKVKLPAPCEFSLRASMATAFSRGVSHLTDSCELGMA